MSNKYFEIPKCRSCQSDDWNCNVTVTHNLDRKKGEFFRRPGEAREFRCGNCGLKSIQEQEVSLEAIFFQNSEVTS